MTGKYFRFGKSLAAVQLVIALESAHPKTAKKISTHLSEFSEGLNFLSSIKNDSMRCRMAKMWMMNFFNHELIIHDAPDFSYDDSMKNIIKYRYRIWLETYGQYNKYEFSRRQIINARCEAKAKAWIAQNLP